MKEALSYVSRCNASLHSLHTGRKPLQPHSRKLPTPLGVMAISAPLCALITKNQPKALVHRHLQKFLREWA